MDSRQAIANMRLEEAGLREIEESSEIDDIQRSQPFKEKVALLVILTFCDARDPFHNYHRRLVVVFLRITNAQQVTGEPKSFGRPIVRRNQPVIKGGDQRLLYSWSQGSLIAIDVPMSYQEGFKSALLFLLASDATRYFAHHWMEVDAAALEVPCFLEMFQQSSTSDRRNLDALYSEYLALIGFCLAMGCIGPGWTYRCEERQFDFYVNGDNRNFAVSVKSVQFAEVNHFGNRNAEEADREQHCRLVRIEEGHNVVVHNCPCEHCSAVSSRSVSVTHTPDGIVLDAFECINRDRFESFVTAEWTSDGSIDRYELAVIHLVSARGLFEVRHALYTFSQKTFRGTNYRLRDRLSARLLMTDGVAVDAVRPALVDRR